jgi:hypothetical protein
LRRCRSIFLGASLGLHANRPDGKAGLESHRPPRRPRGNEGAGCNAIGGRRNPLRACRCSAIAEFVRELETEKPPAMLYHYTDDGGLKGILESGNIRLT